MPCDCTRCTNGLPDCNRSTAMNSLLSPHFKAVMDFVARCDDRDFRNVLDNLITTRKRAVADRNTVSTLDYIARLDDLSVMVNGGTL